jgi:transposase
MILAITTGLSNARREGYNRIVKHIGGIAFGFRNPGNQRRRVRWACTRQSRQAPLRTIQLHSCQVGRAGLLMIDRPHAFVHEMKLTRSE